MQTITERILSNNSGNEVSAGDFCEAEVDVVMGHDPLIALLTNDFDSLGVKIKYPKRVIFTADHFCPPASIERADILRKFLDFAKKHNINTHMFTGICHQILIEDQKVVPGKVVIGSDSHTVTTGALGCFATGMGSTDILAVLATGKTWLKVPKSYKIDITGKIPKGILGKDIILNLIGELGENGAVYKALEFYDNTENGISMDSRFSITNMVVECGAKNGIFSPDAKTKGFVLGKEGVYGPIFGDDGATYERNISLDVTNLKPQVAKPHSPANVVDVDKVAGTHIDQIFIGSCTGGRLEDLAVAAKILEGRKVHPDTKAIAIPSSNKIFSKATAEGYIKTLIDAGVCVSNPSCGPCGGIDKGILADNEVCLSTSNRNFQGRMGSKSSQIYLCSTATAAASAIEGSITDPTELTQ